MSTSDFVDVPVVTWEFDPGDDAWANRVLGKTEEFLAVIRSVAGQVLPQSAVKWAVESMSMSSPLLVKLRPVASDGGVSVSELVDLTATISRGFRMVQRGQGRPPYFTDDALTRARALAMETMNEGTRIRVGAREAEPTELTADFVAHVDTLLGETVREIGTIEGRLEAFNVHGSNRYFSVYDDLSGVRIRCDFGTRIPSQEIGAAAERRVAVQGEIESRENGTIVRVKAHGLEVFPLEEDLPSPEDVRGIL